MRRTVERTPELSKEARRLLEIAPDPAGAFTELHEMALMDTIEANQRRYEQQRRTETGPASAMNDSESSEEPALMPRESVLACLEALGWEEGYDEAASAHFFGPPGLDGYTDGRGGHAFTTLGGFVFNAPDGDRYVVSGGAGARLLAGRKNAEPRDRHPQGRRSLARRLLGGAWNRRATVPFVWNLERAGRYTVEPCCLYEDLTIEDLGADGLIGIYPLDDPESRANVHTGEVVFETFEEAIAFTDALKDALNAEGVLCEPRVVLKHAGLITLAAPSSEDQRYDMTRRESCTMVTEEDRLEASSRSAFLGGHIVRRGLYPHIPAQAGADGLASRASWLAVSFARRDELARRVGDGRIPSARRATLARDLDAVQGSLNTQILKLEDDAVALSGLLSSLLHEREELTVKHHPDPACVPPTVGR